MIDYFLKKTQERSDADYLQAVLNVVLRKHRENLLETEELENAVKNLLAEMEEAHDKVEELILANSCMLSHFSQLH